MKVTKSKLKQIIKEELQQVLEEDLMDRILSLPPGSKEMKDKLGDLARRAHTDAEAAATLTRLKDQYARKVATGEGDGKWARMAQAVYDNMTRTRG